MAEFSFIALKDEIVADSLALEYKNSATPNDWKGDQVIADIINNADGTNPRTLNQERVDTGDIRSDTTFEGFEGLVTVEQAWFEWLTANGSIKVNAEMLQKLAGSPIASDSIWAVSDRAEMNAAMLALMQFIGSRALELWNKSVSPGDVGRAFNTL